MNISLNTTAVNHGKLSVFLKKEDFHPQINQEIDKIKKNAKIKGFRQGSVPTSMIQKLYGDDIKLDVVNKIINKAITDYQQDNNISFLGDLLPVSEPMNLDSLNKEEIEFTYEVGIAPQVDLEQFISENTLTQYVVKISDQNANEEFDAFIRHFSELKEVDSAIESGDMIKMKILELENGQIKENGVESEFSIIYDELLHDDLKNKLTDAKKSDRFNIEIDKIEKNTDEKTIRRYFLKLNEDDNREVGNNFQAEIISISRKATPEINQDLFQKAYGPETEINSEEALREKLRQDVTDYYKGEADKMMLHEVSRLITHCKSLHYPDQFLKNWLGSTFDEWKQKSEEDFNHDLYHFKEGLNWQLFKRKITSTANLKVELNDVINIIISKYKAQIPGLNLPDEQWNQIALKALQEKEKAEEFYNEAVSGKMLEWLKDQLNKQEVEISVDDFKEKVKDLNRRAQEHHHDHDHEHHHEHQHE